MLLDGTQHSSNFEHILCNGRLIKNAVPTTEKCIGSNESTLYLILNY